MLAQLLLKELSRAAKPHCWEPTSWICGAKLLTIATKMGVTFKVWFYGADRTIDEGCTRTLSANSNSIDNFWNLWLSNVRYGMEVETSICNTVLQQSFDVLAGSFHSSRAYRKTDSGQLRKSLQNAGQGNPDTEINRQISCYFLTN